jgi:nucleoside diphosphate kinase
VGDKDPKNSMKNTMRSFYANDRFDNAFFSSENFSESLIERDILFTDEGATGHSGIKINLKVKNQA